MKLYATVTSERDSRPARKGGDSEITIDLYRGNDKAFRLRFNEYGMLSADCLHGPNAGHSCSVLWEEYQALNAKKRKQAKT